MDYSLKLLEFLVSKVALGGCSAEKLSQNNAIVWFLFWRGEGMERD